MVTDFLPPHTSDGIPRSSPMIVAHFKSDLSVDHCLSSSHSKSAMNVKLFRPQDAQVVPLDKNCLDMIEDSWLNVGVEEWSGDSGCKSLHRHSCHRCGNIRKNNTHCKKCPQIYCTRCAEKMMCEYGEQIFACGCPVCLRLCCCSAKSLDCPRQFHCYKKCPCTRQGLKGYSTHSTSPPTSPTHMETAPTVPASPPRPHPVPRVCAVENADPPRAVEDSAAKKTLKRSYRNMTASAKFFAAARETARQLNTNLSIPLPLEVRISYPEEMLAFGNPWGKPLSIGPYPYGIYPTSAAASPDWMVHAKRARSPNSHSPASRPGNLQDQLYQQGSYESCMDAALETTSIEDASYQSDSAESNSSSMNLRGHQKSPFALLPVVSSDQGWPEQYSCALPVRETPSNPALSCIIPSSGTLSCCCDASDCKSSGISRQSSDDQAAAEEYAFCYAELLGLESPMDMEREIGTYQAALPDVDLSEPRLEANVGYAD